MADGKVLLEVVVEGKNVKVVQREVEQVTDAVNENTTAQKRNSKAAQQNAESVSAAEKAHRHFDRGLKGAAGASSSSTKNFSKMRDAMEGSSGLVGAYATLAANLFAATAAFSALQKAAQAEQIAQGLIFLGKSSGIAMQSLASGLQKATGFGISLQESMKNVALVTSAGFDTSYIERLGKVARNTSTVLGRDMGESLDRLVRGATKLEPELLDELGIMVRIDDAASKYAAALGKSASSLTTFEKQQAFMNAVLEEGEKKFGGLEGSVDVNPYDKLSASLQELSKTFLNLINTVLKPLVGFLAENKVVLAAFIALLSKSVINTAFQAFTDLTKTQAIVAMQQKNIAVQADSAAKRNIETQKTKIKLFDTSFGKWGKEQNLLLQNAKTVQDYEALQIRAQKSLDARQRAAARVNDANRAAWQERNAFLTEEIKKYQKIIDLEKKRAIGAKMQPVAPPVPTTEFGRLRQTLRPVSTILPTQAATAESKLANRTLKSLSSLDIDSSFANYSQQFKYAIASGAQYRKSMKGVEEANLTGLASFLRFIPGIAETSVALKSVSGALKIAAKGFFALIPFIGEVVIVLWTLWDAIKFVRDAFKTDETKAFETALEETKTKLSEVATNSQEVNKAIIGQSASIKTYSQLVTSQSNIINELNSSFTTMADKAEAAGDGYADIAEAINSSIKDNALLTESFKEQSNGLKDLESWKRKNNATDEEAVKYALKVIETDKKVWHEKVNIIKSIKEANKATTDYLNSLVQTSPLATFLESFMNIGKAFSNVNLESGDYLLTINQLNKEQARLLGLSDKQYDSLRDQASAYEALNKRVGAYTELTARQLPKFPSRSEVSQYIQDFNSTVAGSNITPIEVPTYFTGGEELNRRFNDVRKVSESLATELGTDLEQQRKTLEQTLFLLKPVVDERLQEAKNIKLSLTWQQQVVPALEKYYQIVSDIISARKEEINLLSQTTTLQQQISNLKAGGSGNQSAQQAYELEKQLLGTRKDLLAQETKNTIDQLKLQKATEKTQLLIERFNLRNLLANSNLNKDELKLLQEQFQFLSDRLGVEDKSAAVIADREVQIKAEKDLADAQSVLLEGQLRVIAATLSGTETANKAIEAANKISEQRISAELAANNSQDKINEVSGRLIKEQRVQTLDEIYALRIANAQSAEEKQLLEFEKNILTLGNAANQEKLQAAVDASELELSTLKLKFNIEQKIISSRLAILDDEKKLQEQTLMLQNLKNPAIADFKLTLEQQYELELRSAEERKKLINEEAASKVLLIKKEGELLKAQMEFEKAKASMTIVDIQSRMPTFDTTKAEGLIRAYEEAISRLPESTDAEINQIISGARVAVGEIDTALALQRDEISKWTKNFQVDWDLITVSFGERLKEDLRNSIPLVKQMADAFSGAIDSAVDGLVTALIEGKNIFKSIGEAVRNTLLESFSDMAKDSFKQGIKGLLAEVPFFNTEQDKKPDINQAATSIANSNTSIAQSNNAISETLSQIPAALSSLSCTCVNSAMQTSQPASPYVPTPGSITDTRGIPITGLSKKDNQLLMGTNQSTSIAAEEAQKGNWLQQKWGEAQTYATENVGTIAAAGFASIVTAIAAGRSTKSSILGGILGIAGTVVGGMFGGGPAGAAFGGQVGAMIGARADFAKGGVMSSSGPMPLQKYANGGIARTPQLAMFGEGSRPEAYVPLPDGRSIPVTMSNSGGNVNNISVNVNVEGGQAQAQTAGGVDNSEDYSRRLGVAITNAVKQEIFNQQRPGGLLFRGRK